MSTAALELRGVTSGYGEKTVVRNLSLTLPAAGSLAVLGPNGAGKTTFLKTCSGLIRPTGGQILLAGRDVTKTSTSSRVKVALPGASGTRLSPLSTWQPSPVSL